MNMLWQQLFNQATDGLNFVFEGMGGEHGDRALAILRRGGKLVAYAAPSGGVSSIVKDMFKLIRVNLFLKGKSAEFYASLSFI